MPLPAIILTAVVMCALLVWQGVLVTLERAWSTNPASLLVGALAMAAFAAFVWWGNRLGRRKTTIAAVALAFVAVGTAASYDTNQGRGVLGFNSAKFLYRQTGIAVGSFAERLEAGARAEIAYAERCDAAIGGSVNGIGADVCRKLFADGVDRTSLARLKAATAARDWKTVENMRRSLGDDRGVSTELWLRG
jgi:MFS family permease